jgi:predicted kinase
MITDDQRAVIELLGAAGTHGGAPVERIDTHTAVVFLGGTRVAELEQTAREYLALAGDLLHPPAPSLVAIGGLSGSGKSTLAVALAPSAGPVPGAVVLRSDEVRKRLCGVEPLRHLVRRPTPRRCLRACITLAERARLAIRGGHSVIVDAVYVRPADRQAIARVAAEASVPLVGLWLDAPDSTLIERITSRPTDASDADAGPS